MIRQRRPKVFGSGLIALDVVVGLDSSGPIQSYAGGTCGNVLTILAYLGWDAYPIARLNEDSASKRVRADMSRWGVKLDFSSCEPTTDTPIIVQEIKRKSDGSPTHRFTWACPQCGEWLPTFKAITLDSVETVTPALRGSAVFFIDRISRATLTLAEKAAASGAIIFFEPAGKSDEKLFREALRIAHVVKYADQRFQTLDLVMQRDSANLLEIQTRGELGLRYRHRLAGKISGWRSSPAITLPSIADTCGSGDWCTAGILTKIAGGGQEALRDTDAGALADAMRYGQALAAWNCLFEGARGGMYSENRSAFSRQIGALMRGQSPGLKIKTPDIAVVPLGGCPSCENKESARISERSPNARGERVRVTSKRI